MISGANYAAMLLTLLICFGVPIAALVLLERRFPGRSVILAFFTGMLGFFATQILIRIPLLDFFQTKSWFLDFAQTNAFAYMLALAFTAGLFETAGRYLVAKFLIRDKLSFPSSLAAGIGHGGCEAMAFVGLTYVNNLLISIMISTGTLDKIISDPAVAAQLTQTLTASVWSLFVLAGFERLVAMAFHAAAFVLLGAFMQKNRAAAGFIAVTLLHTLFDFSFIVLMQYVGTVVAYACITLLAIAGIVFIARRWKRYVGELPT